MRGCVVVRLGEWRRHWEAKRLGIVMDLRVKGGKLTEETTSENPTSFKEKASSAHSGERAAVEYRMSKEDEGGWSSWFGRRAQQQKQGRNK